MSAKKIAIVTGTRAEFGIWQPVLRAIQASKKLQLQLIATGMHLQRRFGYTLDEIKASGVPLAAVVPMYKPGGAPADALARATVGLAKAFRQLKPDLVMVLGDRLEALATASAALACQLPLAHLHGGESAPAQWDEQIRHAVTKIAHLHFCATKKAARRIAQMGEDPACIFEVGAPALDLAMREAEVCDRALPAGKRVVDPLIVLHPSSADEALEYRRAKVLIETVHGFFKRPGQRLAVLGPNNDLGHRGILRAYGDLREKVSLTMSVSQHLFWGAMHHAGLLLGNSSAGILEAATFGCAVVNIGDRQAGRERNGNVIDVPWSAGERGIEKAIDFALSEPAFRRRVARRTNLYGDGHASERIVAVLESLRFPLPTIKRFHDR